VAGGVSRPPHRRYVYAPVQGQLSLGIRGDQRPLRQVVQAVLDDILPLSAGEVDPDR
jgi:hypothetical protein